jgi:hypothetical protein
LAEQLKNQNQLTDEQFNQLQDLANQGHRIGKIQGLLEALARKSNGNRQIFQDTAIEFEGRSYNTLVLSKELTISYNDRLATSAEEVDPEIKQTFYIREKPDPSQTDHYGNSLLGFMRTFIEARDKGALQNKAVEKLVFSLSDQLKEVSISSGRTVFEVFHPKISLSPNDFTLRMAKIVSHTNSENICTVGGGSERETQGIHCAN